LASHPMNPWVGVIIILDWVTGYRELEKEEATLHYLFMSRTGQ